MARPPNYSIGTIDKKRDVRQPKIGVAWSNDNGTISLRLDPFVVLHGGPDLVVTLFPSEGRAKAARTAAAENQSEDIPF